MQGPAHTTTNLMAALLFPYQAVTEALHVPFSTLHALALGFGILLASKLPDQIEKLPFLFHTHRGGSHLPLLWVLLGTLPHIFWPPHWASVYAWGISGLALGALIHVASDIWDRGGIPLLTPRGTRISLRFYATGKTPAFLGVALMACIFMGVFLLFEWPHYTNRFVS